MKNLTEGNIRYNFFFFALPIVLASLLSQAYQIVDTVIAGRMIGEVSLSAIGATAPLITFVSSILLGYSNGFSIYIARLFGAGEYRHVRDAVCSHLILVCGISVVLGVFVNLFHDGIFAILNVAAEIRPEAYRYFGVYMAGLPFIMVNSCFVHVMNSLGASEFPFYMSVLSTVLNICGNVIAVGCLGLGVMGIALSTLVSAVLVSLCDILWLCRSFREKLSAGCGLNISLLEITPGLSYALPVSLQQTIMYFSGIIISPSVNAIGPSASAAYTVVNRIYQINAGFFENSARSLSNYTSQCCGAGKYEQVKKGIPISFVQMLFFTLPVVGLFRLFPEQSASLFFEKGFQGESLRLTVVFVRCVLPFILLNAVNNNFHNLYRGVGKMRLLMLSTGVGAIVRIATTLTLINAHGMYGFYISWIISWAAEAVLSLILFLSGKWKPTELLRIEKSS